MVTPEKQEKKQESSNDKQTAKESKKEQNTAKGTSKESKQTRDYTAYDADFVYGTGTSKSSNKKTKTKTVIDAEWWEDVGDTTTTSLTTTQNYKSGSSVASSYLNQPISGLLPAPRDDD